MQFTYPKGATPIDEEQLEGLIPDHITLQQELNDWEAQNIAEAKTTLYLQQNKVANILTVKFARDLHKKMFDRTWRWAGKFRTRQTNIGVEAYKITIELAQALGDAIFWIDNETYSFDEIGVRFHHKLVWIHPFPNGNGRFGRLYTDLLMKRNDCPPFSWGTKNLISASQERTRYLQSLYDADNYHDYASLLNFVRE